MWKAAALALVLTLCACATGEGSAAPDSTSPPVRFGVIGDQTGVEDLDGAYRTLQRGVAALNLESVELVVHTGDLIESTKPESEVRADWARARAILSGLNAPWMLAPGDHDVNPPGWVTGSSDRSRETLFKSLYGEHAPDARTALWQVRDVRGVRFIALNSHETLHADPRWGNIFMASISASQRAWLAQALDAKPKPRAIVVFLHQPLWYSWAAWAPVHDLLRSRGVDLVIGGHFHYGQDEGELDGVRYIVVGATGGMTKHGSANAGARHHVSVIEVGADNVSIRVLPLAPEPATVTLAPRRDMDRVQAVSSMLWSAQRGGRTEAVQADCTGIASLGNPIDLPLRLSVTTPDSIPLAGRFAAGFCDSDARGCIVAPVIGVQSSNLSTVNLAQNSLPAWNSAAPVNSVSVEASFEGDAGPYTIRQTMNAARVACRPVGSPD
jgi:predicted MPP superfamily phosphohydrolase